MTERKSSGSMPRGILHQTDSMEKRRAKQGIAWNENNLAENEKIKSELNPVKITEPKTPYHSLLPDEDIDLEPLALDGSAPPLAAAAGAPAAVVSKDAHSKFEEARKAHYNMKNLLAKNLLAQRHDFDDEDEETESDSTK